jgi:putative Mg2+ transporter-C (MgtC) family protein
MPGAMTEFDFFWRVAIGTLCGAIIGFERARDHKSIGMRTLGLVGLGAALVITAVQHTAGPTFDSTARVMQGMLAGIGFLGAGVILHGWQSQRTHGMTTAAAIWLAAILGMVAGIGEIVAALCGAAVGFILLILGGHVDRAVGQRLGAHEDDEREN